jgi:hypothetical protein
VWRSGRPIATTGTLLLLLWATSVPTHTASTMSTATCGIGLRIVGTPASKGRRQMDRRRRRVIAAGGWSGVGAMATLHRTSAPPTDTGSPPGARSTALVFGWLERKLLDLCPVTVGRKLGCRWQPGRHGLVSGGARGIAWMRGLLAVLSNPPARGGAGPRPRSRISLAPAAFLVPGSQIPGRTRRADASAFCSSFSVA